MNHRTIGLVFAGGFFVFWMIVLYAGADHPPPLGFLWVVLLDAVAALLVGRRVPTYLAWSLERKPWRWMLAVRDGAVTGLVFGAIPMLLPGTGQPGVHPTSLDRLVWFIVLMSIGSANTLVLYAMSVGVQRFLRWK